MSFPDGFVWGAAAAAYQIEGSAYAAGKGLSVWDMFTRKPGAIFEGHTGDVACDHYTRYAEDVGLMQQLGLHAYRLSISWPRIVPAGTGTPNVAGLDFYDRLIDALLAHGITPYVTLFHWDYPLELYYKGGWLNPDSPAWFAEYTSLVTRRLGDRVQHYVTLNEPQVFIGLGHLEGTHAPGDKLRFREMLQAGHHALLAHGKAVQAIRAETRGAQVGFSPVVTPRLPASDTEADIAAARQATFAVREKNSWTHSWWMDPVFFGSYPQDGLEFYGHDAPRVGPGDLSTISAPVDFLGMNNYQGLLVEADGAGGVRDVPFRVGHPRTAFNWPITPDSLYWGPRFLYERYQKPLLITENGLSVRDWVAVDGGVHDTARIDFTARYLRALHRAIQDGTEVRGYFHWSILDNFEWAEGYKERFGLIHVDYQTQKRTLKDSAHWYRRVIESNGAAALADSRA